MKSECNDRTLIHIYSRHPIAAKTLEGVLEAHDFAKEIVVVSQGRHLMPQARGALLQAQLSILDGCGDDRWPEIALQWRRTGTKLLILLCPDEAHARKQVQALFLGISGVVVVSGDWSKELLQAIRAVREGMLWMSREALNEYFRRTAPQGRNRASDPDFCQGLTLREEQVLSLLLGGASNKKIATILEISERTVKYHVSNILQKSSVFNRKELIETASAPAHHRTNGAFAAGEPAW